MKKHWFIFLCTTVFCVVSGSIAINSIKLNSKNIDNSNYYKVQDIGGSISISEPESNSDEQKEALSIIHVQVDGEVLQLSRTPVLLGGNYMVPAEEVIAKLDAEFSWDHISKQIVISKEDMTMLFTIDSTIVSVNGVSEKVEVAPIILEQEVLIPIKFIAQKFGITKHRDDESKIIILEKPSQLLLPYTKALDIFQEGVTAQVTDIDTGITYYVKRIGGQDFADVEPLTAEDTENLLYTYDGEWSWKRRAVIVTIDGMDIAASMAGMPHSGREDAPFGAIVDNRSGGTGRGINLNSIRDNNMNGVVDIYFYNSLVPGLNRVDERHQHMVMKAAKYKK